MKKASVILAVSFIFLSCIYAQKKNTSTTFSTSEKIISDICFTGRGSVLCVTDGKNVKAFLSDSGELLAEFDNGHSDRVLAIDISLDSTLMVTGGRDSTIIIRDFIGNRILKSLKYHKGIVTSVKISPDNNYILSGGTDNKVILYDIRLEKVVHEFNDHKDVITCVIFSKDGKRFASSGGDGIVNIYNTDGFTLAASFEAGTSRVRSISFSDNGQRLISCGDDRKAVVWITTDLNNIRKELMLRLSAGWLLSSDYHEDCQTFTVGDIYGNVLIIGKFGRYKAGLRYPVNQIRFKPATGSLLSIAVATRGKGVVLIKAENMKYKAY